MLDRLIVLKNLKSLVIEMLYHSLLSRKWDSNHQHRNYSVMSKQRKLIVILSNIH